jgi:hypothetical protein
MAHCGAQIATITANRTRATASWKMIVKELGNDCFVDASDAQTLGLNPLSKVGNAAQVAGKRRRRVAAISQVLLVRINVKRERPFDEPVCTGESR